VGHRATAQILAEKIRTQACPRRRRRVGYVGLPLAVEFAKAGFTVTGIDISEEKVRRVNAGDSYVGDIPSATLAPLVESGKLRATTDFSAVLELDTINICVPTPLRKTKDPDMSFIVSSCAGNRRLLPCRHAGDSGIHHLPGDHRRAGAAHAGQERAGWGRDFFLCFSPERVDPGNPKYQTVNIPKVVGGCTPACTEMGRLFYAQALEHVVPVSSTQVAEMVKLLENTFRMINIGLVNEMALMCDRMGIDVWEVIDAAATKPFGFMPFYPGPGWAGTASRSIRFIFPGRPSRPASRRASSNWRATSTGRCRTLWPTRCRTRSTTRASR
jgi:UDP-N-acetyl-D-glucosamine dehydrogenase